MGSVQNWVCWNRSRHITIPIFLVLVTTFSTHFRFTTEAARPIPTKLAEPSLGEHVMKEERVGAGVAVNARQIGSRPPQCETKCSGCGHCVAVQVPVAPQVQQSRNGRKRSSISASTASPKNIAYYRGGSDLSNYKPISWKCKCGDFLFNP